MQLSEETTKSCFSNQKASSTIKKRLHSTKIFYPHLRAVHKVLLMLRRKAQIEKGFQVLNCYTGNIKNGSFLFERLYEKSRQHLLCCTAEIDISVEDSN